MRRRDIILAAFLGFMVFWSGCTKRQSSIQPAAQPASRPAAKPASRPSTDDLETAAAKIRAKYPQRGEQMWKALGKLIEPGMTVKQMETVLSLKIEDMAGRGAWGKDWCCQRVSPEVVIEAWGTTTEDWVDAWEAAIKLGNFLFETDTNGLILAARPRLMPIRMAGIYPRKPAGDRLAGRPAVWGQPVGALSFGIKVSADNIDRRRPVHVQFLLRNVTDDNVTVETALGGGLPRLVTLYVNGEPYRHAFHITTADQQFRQHKGLGPREVYIDRAIYLEEDKEHGTMVVYDGTAPPMSTPLDHFGIRFQTPGEYVLYGQFPNGRKSGKAVMVLKDKPRTTQPAGSK